MFIRVRKNAKARSVSTARSVLKKRRRALTSVRSCHRLAGRRRERSGRAPVSRGGVVHHRLEGKGAGERKLIAMPAAAPAVVVEPAPLYPSEPDLIAKVVRLRELDARVTREILKRVGAAQYLEAKILGGNHINKAYVMRDGDIAEIYKPQAGQHKRKERSGIPPETQWRREIAASEIARALGISILPQTREFTWQGEVGSAQLFQEEMISGAEASLTPHKIPFDKKTSTPANLPEQMAEDWQLLDDLLMHGDRHKRNYLLKLDAEKNITGLALIDNGLSLTADLTVMNKRFKGPREGGPMGAINQERLRQFIDHESSLTLTLTQWLEPAAIQGLLARAKALLERRRYGNFLQSEINLHLPAEWRAKKSCIPQGFRPGEALVKPQNRRGRTSSTEH